MTSRYTASQRRAFLLGRLAQANGETYDELCRAVIETFPEPQEHLGRVRGVRTVRRLLFEGLAVTEPDESCWLTPAGWLRARELEHSPAGAQVP